MLTRKVKIAIALFVIALVIGSVGYYYYYLVPVPLPKKVIKIGSVLPLTGPMAADARCALDGHLLAVKEFNERGGVLGSRVELIWRDDENTPDVGARRVKELVEVIGVDFLVGHIHSGMAMSTQAYAKEKGMIYISTGIVSIKFCAAMKDSYTFCYIPTPYQAFGFPADYFLSGRVFPVKRIYIVASDYEYGWVGRDIWVKTAKKYGVEVVGIDLTPLPTMDFSPFITKILVANPDMVVAINVGAELTAFTKQCLAFGVKAKGIKIVTGPIGQTIARAIGKEAMFGNYGFAHFDPGIEKFVPETNEFNKKWMEQYGYIPTSFTEIAYSEIKVLLTAIERARSLDPKEIMRVLQSEEFVTARGKVRYDPITRLQQTLLIIVKGKDPAKMTSEYDVFEIEATVSMEESKKYNPSPAELGYPS